LRTAIDTLQNRFDFAALSDTEGPTQGWKLAYQYTTGDFTPGTYDGYSGEPWLISLAAALAHDHHVPITTHYHSGMLRERAYLVDPARAHLVHTMPAWRAPFVQWLLPLFVDVSTRGIDTYPQRELAANPLRNAIDYELEADAKLAELGRDLLLQPDAGDDGSGTYYKQFSLYDDHDRPDLFMPWSVAFSLLGDANAAEDVAQEMMQSAIDAGVNFFDNAEVYAGGEAEIMMGKVVKKAGWKRSDLVFSTKIFWGGEGANDKGLSRKHIIEGIAELVSLSAHIVHEFDGLLLVA
jgi:hypothetical protein